jgi:hypothetical protein
VRHTSDALFLTMRQRLVVVSACSRFGAVYQGIATARSACLWCAYGSMSLQPAVDESSTLIHRSAWNRYSRKFISKILHSRAPHTPKSPSPDTPHSPGPLGLVTPVDRYPGLWMRLLQTLVCGRVCPLSRVCLNRTAGLPHPYTVWGRLDAAFDGVVNFVELRKS